MATEARVLANRYELGAEVGRGGMARVYIARDRLLERTVAVKVLSELDAHDATAVERFRREAQAAARLNHPNIVGVYDWGEDDDTAFIVMEFVDGQTLRDLIQELGLIPALEAARIAAEIADALGFAHRNGVVHRDVKPGNVLITDDGQVKVTDFGIARADSNEALTKTGSVMGTATYFSPEQAQGHDLDRRSDVYSLGVVLYEMVTGVPPFIADSPVSVAYKHVRETPTLPSTLVPELSGAMDRIVLTAMAKDVDERYQSADELRADLLRFERGRPLLGGPITAMVAELPTSETAVQTRRSVAVPAPTEAVTRTDAPGLARRPGTEPSAAPARAGGRHWGAIAAISTAMALLLALIVVLIVNSDIGGGGTPTPTVDVVSVVGKQFEEAEATLTQAGFKVTREDTPAVGQPGGLVLGQSPEDGSKAKKGSTVTLTVSSATLVVPDVVGKTRDQAAAALRTAGIIPVFAEVDSDQPPGTVLAIVPAANGTVPKNFAFANVQVAKEPPVAIPEVVNQDPTAASNVLGQAGFLQTTHAVASDAVPVGKVVGTDPPAGTLLPKGSTVTLLVSSGPALLPIPNTVGQAQAAAEAALIDAGFNVSVAMQPATTPADKGKVISQNPAGGEATRLTTVSIVVGT